MFQTKTKKEISFKIKDKYTFQTPLALVDHMLCFKLVYKM